MFTTDIGEGLRNRLGRCLGKSIPGRGWHAHQSSCVPGVSEECEDQCGPAGSQQGGKMWEMNQLGHGHRACRAWEVSVRILASTLNGRLLEAIEQDGA